MSELIKCHFNLFDEGRKYTGHHRQYILENAQKVCYAPETREGMRLREKLGYLGHGRREMAKKVRIGEVETVNLPDGGAIIVENVPSNVTTFFEINEDGVVEHHQEILESAPGKIVQGLNQSRVGGFSWAMGGRDGGRHGATTVTSFEGFDYVMNPGFSANRGYILESADAKDMILENICALGVPDKEAEQYLESWVASAQFQADELAQRLEDAAVYESALVEEIEGLKAMVQTFQESEQRRRGLITEGASNSAIVIPEDVAEAMISMANEEDFLKLMGFFESAGRVDLSQLPLPGRTHEPLYVDKNKGAPRQGTPEYGTAAAAVDFKTIRFASRM